MPPATEINFDGLVGPTHNYSGLSYGNVASMSNKLSISNPRAAALQGLAKMKMLHDLGVPQAVIPPHERPHVYTLRALGFSGSDEDVLRAARAADPVLLPAVCSASSMWTANAATVSPSADTKDNRVHFTPANLISQFHRSIEPPTTARILKSIFPESAGCFVHHDPLPAASHFADEGAANHMRLAPSHGEPGIEVFVYGRRAFESSERDPKRFPARQTFEACAAIARNHQLLPERTLFLRQNPKAIDAGAFHNDVVSVANCNVLLHHAEAYVDPPLLSIARTFVARFTIDRAVKTYLFNSQLVTLTDGRIALIAPSECEQDEAVQSFIAQLIAEGAIAHVHYADVRQSMQNGGGPACLRLRVVLTDEELAKMNVGVMFTNELFQTLVDWVAKHYREELRSEDLIDPKLLEESRTALDELTKILNIGDVYDFQSPQSRGL